MHACIHAHIHTYIHPSIHPYIHTHTHTHTHTGHSKRAQKQTHNQTHHPSHLPIPRATGCPRSFHVFFFSFFSDCGGVFFSSDCGGLFAFSPTVEVVFLFLRPKKPRGRFWFPVRSFFFLFLGFLCVFPWFFLHVFSF